MNYIECPNDSRMYKSSVFLAGGITGCDNWQKQLCKLLEYTTLTLFNPRRANFPINDPSASQLQIEWEYHYLERSKVISFWFCRDGLQPIVMYELGRWANSRKSICVGVHPDFPRRQDVEIQLKLARPDIEIVYSLEKLAEQIEFKVFAEYL